MTTTEAQPLAEESVPLGNVEKELARMLNCLKEPGEGPVQRAHMSNLVIFCHQEQQANSIAAQVPEIVAAHPARVLLLIGEGPADSGRVTAAVKAWCLRRGSQKTCCEQITLRAPSQAVDRLGYAVRGLLIGDLPTNLWWAAQQPPPFAGALIYDLTEPAQQLIYDSIGWLEPARGVDATASWLERFERVRGQGAWRVASDLNWRRMKYWRRLMGQALDPAAAPGVLESITAVEVEHGPHAVIQAWELVSWLASRLHWQVQAGRVEPGVEIVWQVRAPHGPLRIRIRRLSEGPSEVRRARIACNLNGQPGALNFLAEDDRRLSVVPEGSDAAPRTVTVQPQPLAGLVSRQLSDREHDPVFRESMAVAQVLAHSVLG